MSLLTGISDFFGLDIGTTAIRLVQLHGSSHLKALNRYAYTPVDVKLTMSDSRTDQQRLMAVVRELIDKSGVTTRNVAVGIPSQKVFTTMVDIDNLEPKELEKTIQYQIEGVIPTPLAESKTDWAVLGESPKDPAKVELLVSSVPNEYIESRLDLLEGIGLNVIAFEPDNLALVRAMLPPDAVTPQMVVDIGSNSTDIVVCVSGTPRLTRSIPVGSEAILKSAMQNLKIDYAQAQQFVFKFGLSESKLEGQVYHAIISTVDILITEIEKTINFFQARYPNTPLERIIVTGGASALPEFPLYIANKFGKNVEIGNAWRNVSFAMERQNELLAISNHFGVAAGLAERAE